MNAMQLIHKIHFVITQRLLLVRGSPTAAHRAGISSLLSNAQRKYSHNDARALLQIFRTDSMMWKCLIISESRKYF
jgi:hypothetical protein